MTGKELRALFVTHMNDASFSYEDMPTCVQRHYDAVAEGVTQKHITPLQGRIDALESRQAMCEYTHAQILARLESEKQALQQLVQEYRALTRCLPMDKGAWSEWNAERDALNERAQALRGEAER